MKQVSPEHSILLIDDDEDDAVLFGFAIEKVEKRIRFIHYPDSIKALKDLNSFTLNPDYIFLDLNMPKLSGIEVLKELKRVRRLWHIPVIIYSTTTNADHINQVKTLGATDFISKPNSLTDIIKAIDKVLSNL